MNSIPVMELHSSTESQIKTTQTTCPYCGVGCGVIAHVSQTPMGEKVQVEGDVQHPANLGKLCIKGSHLADTLGLKTRLLHPMTGRKEHRMAPGGIGSDQNHHFCLLKICIAGRYQIFAKSPFMRCHSR
jgi:anaerobic selenocysteine-containing dehydrogenase